MRNLKTILSFFFLLTTFEIKACWEPTWFYLLQYMERRPYTFLYFYERPANQKDSVTNEFINNLEIKESINLNFVKMKVSDIPKDNDFVNSLWEENKDKKLPYYIVITSNYRQLYSGKLDIERIKTMINSPKRSELADQLCHGKHGLFLILLSEDKEENEIVVEKVKSILNKHNNVGFVIVERDDAKEKWLVEQLLSVEYELKKVTKPMVFAVMGRGYVIPPIAGKDVTGENLTLLIDFMNSACSCYLTAAIDYGGSGSGMYLLTNRDWYDNTASVDISYYSYQIDSTQDSSDYSTASIADAESIQVISDDKAVSLADPEEKDFDKEVKSAKEVSDDTLTKADERSSIESVFEGKNNNSKDSTDVEKKISSQKSLFLGDNLIYKPIFLVIGVIFILVIISGIFILIRANKEL
jgi:hypothetical protein